MHADVSSLSEESAILGAIERVVKDFMQSFAIVRSVMDLAARVRTAESERNALMQGDAAALQEFRRQAGMLVYRWRNKAALITDYESLPAKDALNDCARELTEVLDGRI